MREVTLCWYLLIVSLCAGQLAMHLQLSMADHFQRMIGHMASLQQTVQSLQNKTTALELECHTLVRCEKLAHSLFCSLNI